MRHKTKIKFNPSIIAVYLSVFVFVIAMIFVGYRTPKATDSVANAVEKSQIAQDDESLVDDVIATTVAASVAQSTNLPIANSVSNLAITTRVISEFAQNDASEVVKPQIVDSEDSNRSITNYKVKSGDNIDSLAKKFNISIQTIKWANNLTGNDLIVGSTLKILPVDGVLYTVQSGDTVDSLAERYGVNKTRLVLFNDLDVSGLKLGGQIILPEANLPTEERPGYVAPQVATNYFYGVTGTGFGGQTWRIGIGTGPCPTYAFGNCTCYAYNRRVQLGLPVGERWGNAGTWAYYAAAEGIHVSHTPSAGAIMVDPGHVAIVEKVLPNGDLSISEMNAYVAGGGFNIVSGRIVPAGNVGQYWYVR